jgi:hypothetical protein
MFRARGGPGAELAERLLYAASLLADVPGCELWLDSAPEVADGEGIGGARMLRGSTGATASSIQQGWAHRHIVAGEIHVAFGSHSPGDGEMVADWWTT